MKNLENIRELATKLPKQVRDNAVALIDLMGSSIEGIGDEPIEWKPEIAKLLQAVSDRGTLGKNVPVGSIIVGEKVMEQPIELIPLRMWDGRQYWNPDQTEARMICSSPDAKVGYIGYNCSECPHSKWDTEANKSDCSKIKQAIVITSDLSTFFIVNFGKTNYVNGTDWASKMKKAGVQTFKRMYHLSSETHKQYKNVETFVITPTTKTPEEYIEFLQALFDKVSSDRTEHLEAFHAFVLKKGQENKALAYQNTSPEELSAPVAMTEVSPSEDQAKFANKYSM